MFLFLLKSKFNLIGYILIAILAFGLGALLVIRLSSFTNNEVNHEETIKELSFKDIGTLSTQEAYVTVVENMNDVRQVLGINIPGTKSVCVFSHEFLITAGYNFEEIETEVTEKSEDSKGQIIVKLPEAQILSSGILSDKEKVYYESESIFTNLKEEDKAKLRAEMGEKAENIAIENGILDKAKENAKKVLSSFIYKLYSEDDYKVVYE